MSARVLRPAKEDKRTGAVRSESAPEPSAEVAEENLSRDVREQITSAFMAHGKHAIVELPQNVSLRVVGLGVERFRALKLTKASLYLYIQEGGILKLRFWY